MKTNGRCFYCNKSGEVIDHFISKKKWEEWQLETTLLRGELNSLKNLVIACQHCNLSKRDKCPEDFMGGEYRAWKRLLKANQRIGLEKDVKLWHLFPQLK